LAKLTFKHFALFQSLWLIFDVIYVNKDVTIFNYKRLSSLIIIRREIKLYSIFLGKLQNNKIMSLHLLAFYANI
jgi:hypothetical protein